MLKHLVVFSFSISVISQLNTNFFLSITLGKNVKTKKKEKPKKTKKKKK